MRYTFERDPPTVGTDPIEIAEADCESDFDAVKMAYKLGADYVWGHDWGQAGYAPLFTWRKPK